MIGRVEGLKRKVGLLFLFQGVIKGSVIRFANDGGLTNAGRHARAV